MTIPWHFKKLKIEKFWEKIQNKGKGINVGILDTGLADVKGLRRANIKRLDQRGRSSSDGDIYGHGTLCASIIGSSSKKAPGIAPNANLLSFNVSDADGNISVTNVITAINAALKLNCDVLNCSFVLPNATEALRNAIKKAHQNGCFIVASAGNTRDIRTAFPERTPFAICVAATSKHNRPLSDAKLGKWIDIAAPGEKIPVITATGQISDNFKGSSAAAAVVTAIIALALSRARTLRKYDEVVAVLDKKIALSATDIDEPGEDIATGAGLINPLGLINELQGIL